MARPLLIQELTFNGNASDQDLVAYVPNVLLAQYDEFTIYIEFSAAAAAGKAQIETAFPSQGTVYGGNAYPLTIGSYAGTWAAVGSEMAWAVATSQKYTSVTGVFALLRVRITTAVTSGTMKAYIVAAGRN